MFLSILKKVLHSCLIFHEKILCLEEQNMGPEKQKPTHFATNRSSLITKHYLGELTSLLLAHRYSSGTANTLTTKFFDTSDKNTFL